MAITHNTHFVVFMIFLLFSETFYDLFLSKQFKICSNGMVILARYFIFSEKKVIVSIGIKYGKRFEILFETKSEIR